MRTHLCFQIFFIPFYIILSSVFGQCQIDQQSVLIRLKNELQFNSSRSTKLVTWNSNAGNCCTWAGVNCSAGGQVIGLDLSNETISGRINDSSAFFRFKNLQSLNLAANNFNFIQIPSGFGSLTSLTILNLSNSGFSGQIPGELSQLINLEVLDLSSFFSFGIRSLKLENPNLAMLVQNLTQLRVLSLDSVNISSQKSDWCRSLSSSLPHLEVLRLSNCQLSGPLDGSLGDLQSLSVLRLALNNLSASVPDFFGNFTNLTVLNLGACNLHGTFPKILQLMNLQILDLSVNPNLHGSLTGFPMNGSLRSLVLSNTNFSGGIPESIGNLKNLSRIELPKSNFSGRIPKSMENLTQLSYLDFSSNNFTGQIPSFQLCKNLTHIDLSRNSLSGTIPSANFQNLQNLVSVDLRFNAFNGTIPSSLFSLQQLQKIQLSNNNFDGVLVNFSNPSASLLDTLDLSRNKLKGRIPRSFFQLGHLNLLLLSSNNLSDKIETKDFQGLSNLTVLDLSFNSLSVNTSNNISVFSGLPMLNSLKLASCNLHKFPNLRNQSRLITLDLSDNKIAGEIPNWIWEVGSGGLEYMNLSRNQLTRLQEPYVFPDLSVLDLHSNRLTGVIPVPPSTATFIDYSDNLFNSSLSESVGTNLTFAYFFSVSSNLLTGEIPKTICNAFYLTVLDLSNNHFNGSIPRCLIEYGGSLGVLNLGNNSLSGRIEGTFPSFCGLNTLDLHGNSLEGEIPRSLVNCTMLEVLNLGHNKINDTYPCYLRNNTSLRVLVLRSNNFHGSVCCLEDQQVHNNWSKLQILDIAHNHFNGGVPGDSFGKWDAMMTHDDEGSSNKHLSFRVLQLNELYYQDSVTVTVKGLELELVKILTLFTSIDISSNHFSGEIPITIGKLSALYVLNISNNEFNGSVPPSIGNLRQLESLDMSSNNLNGEIPSVLTGLPFLSLLNLSHNQLKGRIPTGAQFNTFEENSYEGNKGLCGFPLKISCNSQGVNESKTSPNSKESNGYDWQFIFTGVGFGGGAAVVIGSLVLSKKGRNFWEKYTNKLVEMICVALGIHYVAYGLFKGDEDDEKEAIDSDESSDESEFESEVDQSKGRYCVFCTKLDFSRKQVIHDARCTCFDPTPVLSTSVSTSSEAESPFSNL